MIPKIIHYCWFGRNPKPELANKCIESWKKFFPDYEIREWNEDNFDVNSIPYTSEAYEAKKYAFVSDYARFWILYNYGGVYFDTDVEVIKSFDDIIQEGSWMGYEFDLEKHYINGAINPGLGFGCEARLPIIKKILDNYSNLHFCRDGKYNLKTIVAYTTEIFIKNGLIIKNGIQKCCSFTLYTRDYFNPLNSETKKIEITDNTRSIHHYMASWSNKSLREIVINYIKYKILIRIIPEKITALIVKRNNEQREKRIKESFKD